MIRLICPNCMKSVSVPDDAAGKETPCPECGVPFPVPDRYTPAVAARPVPTLPPPPILPPPAPVRPEPISMSSVPTDRPPPPPGLVPPAYPSPSNQLEPPLPAEPPVPPVPTGYTHSRGFSLSPRLMAWIPAAALTLILVLTLFNWVGSYVGGSPVFSQHAWRTVSGNPYVNHPLAEMLKQQAAWPTNEIINRTHWDRLMPAYLAMLILAVLLAWAERGVASLDRYRLPRAFQWVAAVWPYRIPVLAALATVALILLAVQLSMGFGLERAVREVVGERFAAERTANANNPAALAALEFKEDQELARFNLERTTWLWLVVVLHFLVVFAMVARAWLERRGNRPPPRVVFQY